MEHAILYGINETCPWLHFQMVSYGLNVYVPLHPKSYVEVLITLDEMILGSTVS